jgi:pimeloyl-ACP methyl ester carboxylesterase
MPDRTLLVPGTQATSLADQNGTVVYNAVRVSVGLQKDDLGGRPPSEWEALLGMEHRAGLWPPTRTSLDPATELHPASVVRTPYDRIWDAVEPWPYDWRGDIRHNALRLLRHLEAGKPQDGRWNLIGHSQGALVIVLASKLTARVDDFSRLVARVILVGAPLAGTMRAGEALLWGSTGLGADKVAIARAVGRTWPSLYQMLPSWRAVVVNDKDKVAPDDQQLTVPGGWPGEFGAGIQLDLLQRARETQALLHGPFSQFGAGVMTMAFQGQKQQSPVTVVCKNGRYPEKPTMKSETGDSLVPSKKTLEWGGGPFANQVTVLTGKPRRHAELCDDEDVVDMILDFLDQEAPPPPGVH